MNSKKGSTFSITKTVRSPLPVSVSRLRKIKEEVLGKHYECSCVFVGTARSRTLNKKYRSKDVPTNVLAFPLDEHTGEIFITVPFVNKQALEFGRSAQEHTLALFIHACLHLKGYEHGRTMDKEEKRLLRSLSSFAS